MSRAVSQSEGDKLVKKNASEGCKSTMDAISVFTFFWSQLMLLQCVKLFFIFKSSRTVENAIPLVALGSVDFLALVKPHCRYVTMGSLLVGFVVIFLTGHYSNHIFIDIALGLCVFLTYKKDRSEWVNRSTWAMRATVIALYVVTGIDKMNDAWASHEYSCCILMFAGFVGLPVFKLWVPSWAPWDLMPHVAVIIEMALPIALILGAAKGNYLWFRFVCFWGALFHCVLAEPLSPMSVYPFTMAMAPMYTFVLPEQAALVADKIVNWLNVQPVLRWGTFLGIFFSIVGVWPELMAPELNGAMPFEYPPYGLWAFAAVWSLYSCVYFLCVTIWPTPQSDNPVERVYARGSLLGSLPWIFICCLAACPYLGIRNYPALAMFSNLRTEGGRPNSFVFGDDFDFLGYQRDYVTVHSSNIPSIEWLQVDLGQLFTNETKRFLHEYNISSEFWIAPPAKGWPYPPTREFVPYSVPFVELRRRVAEMEDFPRGAYINYTRTKAPPQLRLGKVWDLLGVSHPMAHLDHPVSRDLIYNISVRGTEDFKDLETPLTSMENRFVRFRTFDLSYSPCRH